jgi:hypothetical protein
MAKAAARFGALLCFAGLQTQICIPAASARTRVAHAAPEPTRIDALADDAPTLGLPERPADAPTGREFLRLTDQLPPEERERAIYDEIMRGNVPSFLRRLKPVSLASKRSPNHGEPDAMQPRPHEATIWVMPDYLAIGSDTDFIRIPMNLHTATRIALALGFLLPTTKVVDAIHAQAGKRVAPRSLPPSSAMTKNSSYLLHDEQVNADFGAYELGSIVSGHKKDVVVATHRRNRPGSIGLYGWLQHDGIPIQRLSDAHDASYVDYSQGVRLVSRTIRLANGTTLPYLTALRSRETAALLTDEGPTAVYGAFTREVQFAAAERP